MYERVLIGMDMLGYLDNSIEPAIFLLFFVLTDVYQTSIYTPPADIYTRSCPLHPVLLAPVTSAVAAIDTTASSSVPESEQPPALRASADDRRFGRAH